MYRHRSAPVKPASVRAARVAGRWRTGRASRPTFGRWGEVFGDDTVAAAMIDRLVHHAKVISFKGYSYRERGRDLGRVPAANTGNDQHQLTQWGALFTRRTWA